MKNGTEYAKRLKRFYHDLKGRHEVTADPEAMTDPVRQLALALLGSETTKATANKALHKLEQEMTDLNEVRVASVAELASVIRPHVPDAVGCARSVSRALHAVYLKENRLSLDGLKDKGRREARTYLESLDGVDAHAAASVMLWSLGGHAIPVNQCLLHLLKEEGLVSPAADSAEVQGFLERHVPATQAREFALLMDHWLAERGVKLPAKPPSAGRGKATTSEAKKKAKAAKR